jgi:arylsulfatase A-like enzyme
VGGWTTLRLGETTLADLFAAQGYRTAIFGKWHLGDYHPFLPHERGFHEALTFGAGAISSTADAWGNDYFDDTYWRNGRPEKARGYCTDVFFGEAMRFMEANRQRPFFICLTPNAPHAPYTVHERYRQVYEQQGLPPANAAFYGMIANLDENVGRLRRRLAELGLEDNTILIFMTDNGTAAGFRPWAKEGQWRGFNAGMRGIKSSPYDGGHRVPFFLRWPAGGIRKGRDIPQLTAHVDVLPTLAELAGLPLPPSLRLDGTSLAPLLQARAGFPEDRTLVLQNTQVSEGGKSQIDNLRPFVNSAVLTSRWRLVNGKELFDMNMDPGQSNDVSVVFPETVQRLRATYNQWLAGVEPGVAEPPAIPLSHPGVKTVALTCYEWHTDDWIAFQSDVQKLKEANGYWVVEAKRRGPHRFILRQQPTEAPCPIQGSEARIRIGVVDRRASIPPGAAEIAFSVDLEPGRYQLQTWLTERRGAYYVDVEAP